MTVATVRNNHETGQDNMATQATDMGGANEKPRRTRRGFRATRSEAKRLNRRSFAGVGLGLFVFFAIMAATVTFLAGDQVGAASPFGSRIDLSSAEGLVAGLVTGADMFGIIALSLWAAATASDYSTGWVCTRPG